MKTRIITAVIAVAATLAWQAGAQTYDTNNVVVQTFAGSGFAGYVDGVGQQTMFNTPLSIVSDSSSNFLVLDRNNYRIRKITPNGTVSTFVGGGAGSLPGYGTNVSLDLTFNSSMAMDHEGVLQIVIDRANYLYLLRIRPDGYVSQTNLTFLAQDGPVGICVDSQNNVYFTIGYANRIYRYRTDGVVEVFAGSGNEGSADGNGLFTSFNNPTALAADTADNIYVWDSGSHLIRRINQNRDVVTIAGNLTYPPNVDGVGTNATFNSISAMSVDNFGNIIMASGSSIRKMSAATNVVTMAGSFTQAGYTNGAGNLARFSSAVGVCLSQGMIFVADSGNQRIRQISFNPSAQVVSGANLGIGTFAGVTITGTVGRTYRVESSPDTTNWTTRATLLLTSSPYLWIDQAPVSGNKFYRALLLP